VIDRDDIGTCVDIARRCYRALLWVGRTLDKGGLPFDEVHDRLSAQESARRWVTRFQAQLPPDARPPDGEANRFANYFATFLTTSFDLVADPGKRARSDCGCPCRFCTYLVAAPHLQPRKLTKRNKADALRIERDAVEQLGVECDAKQDAVEAVLADSAMREHTAVLAYGREMMRRCSGFTSGAAVLALWRRFAWTDQGSPKRDFALTADAIVAAEDELLAALTR
jgi:hypothetical protein